MNINIVGMKKIRTNKEEQKQKHVYLFFKLYWICIICTLKTIVIIVGPVDR